MEIIPIFGQNLFAIKYTGKKKDEFSRLFELWQDPEFLEDFFEKNKADLNIFCKEKISVVGAIKLTQKMQDRKHTMAELKKIESCKQYLLDMGIVTKKEIIEVISIQ